MEDRFPMDISLRNVSVRLTDTEALDCELNVDNHSCYSSHTNVHERNHCVGVCSVNEGSEEKQLLTAKGIAEELKEKLHFNSNSDGSANSGFLNGCNKTFYKDVRCIDCVDFSVNGLTKCNNIDRINSHLEDNHHYSERTYVDLNKHCEERTEKSDSFKHFEVKQCTDRCNSVCQEQEIAVSVGGCNTCTDNGCTADVLCVKPYSSEAYSRGSFESDIIYVGYESENQMPDIMRLIQKDLSEPYSIYTYRYFIHNWPKLCFLALDEEKCVGAIVCKLDVHKKHSRRGYIAMLAVDEKYRKQKIGSKLVLKAIQAMVQDCADEVVLETEITNKPALRLYENLGFVRDKRLFRYYLNGVDALRLKLWLR